MQRTLESCQSYSQMVQKFQIMFPTLTLPHIVNSNISIFEALNNIISSIPAPSIHETSYIIKSMKNYVDGQQLRIQMNMMECQHNQPVPPSKKYQSQIIDNFDELSVEREAEHAQGWQFKTDSFGYVEENQIFSFLN